MSNRQGKYDFIDAMRGLAILAVIQHHAHRDVELGSIMGHTAQLSSVLHHYGSAGARGVQLFFIVSALTLCLSAERRSGERLAWLRFFVRRFFRIAPMFYCALIIYAVLPLLLGSSKLRAPSVAHFISTLTFTNAWSPYWMNFKNALVPGGWSVAVEMAFYMVFPILFILISSLGRSMIAIAIAILAGIAADSFLMRFGPPVDHELLHEFLVFWLPTQLPVFVAGFALYRAFLAPGRANLNDSLREKSKVMIFGGASMIGLAMLPWIAQEGKWSIYAYAVGLSGMVFLAGAARPILLVNRFTCFVGKVSFSAYLIHFAALVWVGRALNKLGAGNWLPDMYDLTLVVIATAVTLLFSRLAYRWIEQPGQRAGEQVIDFLLERATTRGAVAS
jgi:peptidoglycan/LPS O-acetylase OafA/YrhL